jgi:hypothetical protein
MQDAKYTIKYFMLFLHYMLLIRNNMRSISHVNISKDGFQTKYEDILHHSEKITYHYFIMC